MAMNKRGLHFLHLVELSCSYIDWSWWLLETDAQIGPSLDHSKMVLNLVIYPHLSLCSYMKDATLNFLNFVVHSIKESRTWSMIGYIISCFYMIIRVNICRGTCHPL